MSPNASWEQLLSSARFVDLSQPLTSGIPHWPTHPPYQREEIESYRSGAASLHYRIDLDEHTGTHLDAPIHWITGREREDVASIPAGRLVGPAVVVDKRAEVAADPGYLLTAAELDAHEAEHGPIAPGSWLLLRTGWGARADDEAAFLNAGPDGPVTPGPDVSAARWLAEHPNIVGFGCETVGIDAGAAGGMEPAFPLHSFLLGSGRYGLTQLASLDALPARGALLVVSPLKLVRGTGSPARVLAFVSS